VLVAAVAGDEGVGDVEAVGDGEVDGLADGHELVLGVDFGDVDVARVAGVKVGAGEALVADADDGVVAQVAGGVVFDGPRLLRFCLL
jgi:hypothetical protein